jgi:hypothetical protein
VTKYTADHAGALADIQEAGSAVTFTFASPGTYTASTGLFAGDTTTTVTGAAIRVTGNPLRYQALGLTQTEAPTLLFAPTTYGSLPVLGASVVFGGVTYTVRDVEPLALDGTTIIANVVVAR